jgi:hypothetical protein
METIDTPIKAIRTDLFEGIRYEKLTNKSGAVFGIKTPRRFLPKWKFDITWKYVSAGILVADRHRFHSAEGLFNNAEVWAGYDVNQRRLWALRGVFHQRA